MQSNSTTNERHEYRIKVVTTDVVNAKYFCQRFDYKQNAWVDILPGHKFDTEEQARQFIEKHKKLIKECEVSYIYL